MYSRKAEKKKKDSTDSSGRLRWRQKRKRWVPNDFDCEKQARRKKENTYTHKEYGEDRRFFLLLVLERKTEVMTLSRRY